MSDLEMLDTMLQKTHEWLQDVMTELHWDSRQKAYTALRAVLHALRDRLTVEEATDFARPVRCRTFNV